MGDASKILALWRAAELASDLADLSDEQIIAVAVGTMTKIDPDTPLYALIGDLVRRLERRG